MGVRTGEWAFAPPMEIVTTNKNF